MRLKSTFKKFNAWFQKHFFRYQVPINISFLYAFGSLLGFCLALQIFSGIFLSFFYNSDTNFAFFSVEDHIMRNVYFGWFVRYLHVNVVSFMFLFIYIHIGKALYFRSFTRTKLWFSGWLIFIILMLAAFSGYVLVWGQMSVWAATVITNFFSIVPFFGTEFVEWIWGGFTISKPTLTRFFSIHLISGLFLGILSILHILVLHEEGSSNPIGVQSFDKANFKTFLYKDLFYFSIFVLFLTYFIFFDPTAFMHHTNFQQANLFVTPKNIVPEWYFLPFYTILKSIPHKVLGILAMSLSIISLIILPLIDKNTEIQNPKVRLLWKLVFWLFVFNFIFLGWLGAQPAEDIFIFLGQISTFIYFFCIWFLIPFIGRIETFLINNKKKIF